MKNKKPTVATRWVFLRCAPDMGAILAVQVLASVEHSERSETQQHEGDRVWGGCADRYCEPTKVTRLKQGAVKMVPLNAVIS